MSADNEACERCTMEQQSEVKMVGTSWACHFEIGNQIWATLAIQRLLGLERRGKQFGKQFEDYREFMANYLQLGHMERISSHCYLPHHAVFKPDSTTTKLRVVFDATAATSNGTGHNESMLTGPKLQDNLMTILLRWWRHKVAFSADLEKMYRQILIKKEHQEFQRIVWRDCATDEIALYRLKTVTYGTASAPYLAMKTLPRLANDERRSFHFDRMSCDTTCTSMNVCLERTTRGMRSS